MASLQSAILRFMLPKVIDWNKPLADLRKDLETMGRKVKMSPNVNISSVSAGGVRAELMEPVGAPSEKIIFYLHGGGYCLGIYNINRAFVAGVAAQSGLKVMLLDYRLAPENPAPAAFEDAVTAYRWLLSNDYLPENVILMADSSGCGLSLAMMMALRDNNEPMPKAVIFHSPMLDLKGTGESLQTRRNVDPCRYNDPLGIAKIYLGGNNPALTMFSPIDGAFERLPPMMIHAGDYDVFLSDAVRAAEKAKQAGIEVRFKIWDKMWHNFHFSADILPEGKRALEEIYAYIEEKMKPA